MRQRRPPPPWPPASPSRRALQHDSAEPPAEATSRTEPWHDSYVPVVFLIMIAAVLVGIFFAATGRGGEMAYEHADHAPLDLGPDSSADVALLRPPTALWGYNMQVTDEALDQIARAMRERDVTIAYLQERVANYERNDAYAEPRDAHARQVADAPLAPGLGLYPGTTEATGAPEPLEPWEVPQAPEFSGAQSHSGAPGYSGASEVLGASEVPENIENPETLEAPESPEALRSHEALQSPEALQPPESPDTPSPSEALESPEIPEAAELPEALQSPQPPGVA